ncbi:MAG: signal recognition particle protein [Chloroflexota bacterium]|nr:signal recognition particle protein [Chloroflexota bacterium]
MFEDLSTKIQDTFQELSRKGRISESDVERTLREIRLALLEADVNYRVVKDFTERVGETAVGSEVAKSLTPAQTIIKIVHRELVDLLGEPARLDLGGQLPAVIMLVGLQGSGKTTTAAKLGLDLQKRGERPLLVAADIYRPAAVQQLQTLGEQIDIAVHAEGDRVSPPEICARAVRRASKEGHTALVLDTAGRLQIDQEMMQELAQIKKVTDPHEILLVVDAMTGQEAVSVASEFNNWLGLTGLILTKVDGDARGGAAISVRSVTGVPIKFLGVGEKLSALEQFHPDRLASRILGMGDILTLIERAESTITEDQARKMEKKLRSAQFTLEDFQDQLGAVKEMGPIEELLGMIPGFQQLKGKLPTDATGRALDTTEAIINSMTIEERRNPKIINGSRKRRIARGSGTSVQEVNQLLRQFRQMQQMMKQVQKGRMPNMMPWSQ